MKYIFVIFLLILSVGCRRPPSAFSVHMVEDGAKIGTDQEGIPPRQFTDLVWLGEEFDANDDFFEHADHVRFFMSCKDLVLEEYQVKPDMFSQDFQADTKSWEDLNVKLGRVYESNKDELNRKWKLSGDILKIAFFMNAVNNMWAFGNKETENKKRCWTNYQESLDVDVVCCDEYAKALCMLLDIEGIENKRVGNGNHTYTEVVINGKYYIFDATFNFFVALDNKTFLNQPTTSSAIYHVFPYSHSDPASKLYRKRRGQRRMFYLLTMGRLVKMQPKFYD